MRVGRLAALMALTALPAAHANADTDLVCARPAVLEQVATLLRQAGRPMVLNSAVGEQSAGTDRLVHCAAQGQMLGYDTNQHGMQPIDATFVVNYTLELRRNGIFLHLD